MKKRAEKLLEFLYWDKDKNIALFVPAKEIPKDFLSFIRDDLHDDGKVLPNNAIFESVYFSLEGYANNRKEEDDILYPYDIGSLKRWILDAPDAHIYITDIYETSSNMDIVPPFWSAVEQAKEEFDQEMAIKVYCFLSKLGYSPYANI